MLDLFEPLHNFNIAVINVQDACELAFMLSTDMRPRVIVHTRMGSAATPYHIRQSLSMRPILLFFFSGNAAVVASERGQRARANAQDTFVNPRETQTTTAFFGSIVRRSQLTMPTWPPKTGKMGHTGMHA
jgi:hypothetical protein